MKMGRGKEVIMGGLSSFFRGGGGGGLVVFGFRTFSNVGSVGLGAVTLTTLHRRRFSMPFCLCNLCTDTFFDE